MIPNNDEACRLAGAFFDLQCFLFFVFLFLFSEVDGWYLPQESSVV